MSVPTAKPVVPTKILIVDDSDINRQIYASRLSEIPDIEIFQAANGRDALGLARRHEFAVYLVDVVMPGMDGFELASVLREERPGEPTPILFVTSHEPDPDLTMRGYRMGAIDYLVRVPVDADILVQKVRVFVRMHRKRQELKETLDEAQREIQGLHTKLEEYVQQQEQLRMQATHDTLTKLPNRILFQDRLERAMKRAQRNRQRFGLAYIDLDGFKAINDEHGHATGDALIIAAAQRLLQAVRGVDTVARLGGDEFACILEALDSPTGGEYVINKIHKALIQPLELTSETRQVRVTVRPGASIGLALYPDHTELDKELISLADATMYAAKRGGGGIRIFDPSIREEAAGDGRHLRLARRNTDSH